jgi:cytochrome c biogenesis protein CcdA
MDLSSLARSGTIPVISALLLGLMASIGPCTMATNIAALAYVSRRLTDRKYAILTAALYTAGRMFTYTVLGILIIAIGMETPGIAAFVQDAGEKFLGLFLIIIGLVFLFIDRVSFGRGSDKLSSLGGKIANWGIPGSFPLGALFALAFCPYSAVLFFAVLIPLSLKCTEGMSLPAFFAIGTGLPVLLFGTLLSFGVTRVSSWVNAITRVEKLVRILVSLIFIGIGIYYVVQWVLR